MKDKLQVLKVRMLGQEEIVYGERPIQVFSGRNSVTRAMKLLLILLYNGEEGIARNQLLEALYGSEEIADAGNSLRVTSYRLKKILVEEGLPDCSYISSSGGIYRWAGPMKTEVDVLEFKRLILEAEYEQDSDKKADLLKEACEMYRGELLPDLSGEEWILMAGEQYKRLYSKALKWLTAYLKKQGEYDELFRLAEFACRIYPYDEWQAVKIDCYIEQNMYKEALDEYEHTARLLFEELGVAPSRKMIKQFEAMSEHLISKPQIITEIKDELREEGEEIGPLYCVPPSFRDAYRMTCRSMHRSGQTVYLILCTITDDKGCIMGASKKLEQMSETLYQALKGSLRRSDSFTRYNSSQYLVMLPGISESSCNIVIERITEAFSKDHRAWAKRLYCCISSLNDMEKKEHE